VGTTSLSIKNPNFPLSWNTLVKGKESTFDPPLYHYEGILSLPEKKRGAFLLEHEGEKSGKSSTGIPSNTPHSKR